MMVRKVDLKKVLVLLGYDVTSDGSVEESSNQLGLVSLQNTIDGGILRIHSDSDSFFYKGSDLSGVEGLCFLSRISSKFVYFEGEETIKVSKRDFEEFFFSALGEYYSLGKQGIAG